MARAPVHDAAGRLEPEERYDLVVVGGGISGLAAAHFYRRARPQARILVLDNHDDFGGHAKRNEFTVGGRLLIGYGGSQSIDSPNTQWSEAAKGLLRELGVDVQRFETAFERNLYASLGLSRGVFFAREAFGRDLLVSGDSLIMPQNETSRRLANAKPLDEFVSEFPLSEASKAQLLALYDGARDPLAGRTVDEKMKVLKTTSYRDYLIKLCGCNEEVANCFQGRTYSFFGLGCDAVPAADVRDHGYPGFGGLNLPAAGGSERSEPYIYHFPDGNASLARLLVRGLVPGIAPGNTMEDVVLSLSQQARIYLADLPRQLRGELDLMRSDMLPAESVASMQGDLHVSAAAADRIASTAESISPLVLNERRIVLDEMSRQRALVMEAITVEREQAVSAIVHAFAAERNEVLRNVDSERMATLEWATNERREAIAEVRRELAQSVAALRAERAVVVDDVRHIVDLVLLRVAIFLVAAVVLAPLVAHAYVRVWPRR